MIRAWIEKFWYSRFTPRTSITLNHRNVYILPTPAGWAMAGTIVILLIASINYQLNLGYVLTFLLAGCAAVGMHVCHGNLRGLTLHASAPEPQFAGAVAQVTVQLQSQRPSVRYGLGVAMRGSNAWSWTDVPAQGSAKVQVRFQTERRGLHALPALLAETRYPLGTFRVWTVWRPAAQALVYPAAETHPPPLPTGQAPATGSTRLQRSFSGEYDGVRAYQRGDPLKSVVWKKVAKGGDLVSRDALQTNSAVLWLDLAHTGSFGSGPATLEARLSRLCAWVLEASAREIPFGLRLPHLEIAPATGDAHYKSCLQALALCPAAQG